MKPYYLLKNMRTRIFILQIIILVLISFCEDGIIDNMEIQL